MPVMGAETFADGLSLHAGGGAFITAASFAALGWPVSLLSALPSPPFEAVVQGDIAAANVDASLCSKGDTAVGPQITVAIARGGDRSFLSHKAGAALPQMESLEGPWTHLHFGELRSLVEHQDMIAKARAAGMTISADCGWDDELLAQGESLAEILSAVDVFLPNEAEFDRLCASGLLEGAVPLTAVKCGAKGARARGVDGWIHQPTKPVQVIDATGAGDAFNGGFLSGWLEGQALSDCLIAGNICGAASVGQAGGTGGLGQIKGALTGAA
ncbi:carbohydrate kinase [Alphaproteobacteria bacterium KMM 3653]|uniref:Carbohydrate kinase n=2 Tax=Harenicola maris TaxID=2841044 RepID=A0AAP2G8J4_9RHOB|nr:carbohydrate kinase [Harenicola maris]